MQTNCLKYLFITLTMFSIFIIINGCSKKSNPTGPTQLGIIPASITIYTGNNQIGRIGSTVAIAPAVIVKDAQNNPVVGVVVEFSVGSGGGSIIGTKDTTDANGIASVESWTLGVKPSSNTLTATVIGYPSLVTTISATARLPFWTVMIYMAADNNLAVSGIIDIDEMEAAGVDSEVQVVVQAEFSPTALKQDGYEDASYFNRPNFNTFRYAIKGQGTNVIGPNGSALDLGNRNMADPTQLREFILWAKQNYPVLHYCLILWNHGGGYTGLLQDLTSQPEGGMMSIGELPTAFSGVGQIDVLDFDMCLMGAYETLTKINGYVDFAVFSEEVVPGEGNQYTAILDALQANSSMNGRVLAKTIADQFYASYQGNRASTTISAFDLTGFDSFESALNSFATTLRTNLPALATTIESAAGRSQHYSYAELKDIVDFLDSLRIRVSDSILQSQIDNVKYQVTGSFRLCNYSQNGTEYGANDVSHSGGLTIVLPSRGVDNQLADEGPRSFTAYSSLYSGKVWTQFLSDWLIDQVTDDFLDQGEERFEVYLIWDTAAVSRAVDVDMWILEPSGDLYIPYLGSVTPNGTFTSDSYYNQTSYEGYMTNRFVQQGVYKIYANLYSDPQNFQPVYDIAYRFSQIDTFSLLYDPDYPKLSKATSWLNDPTPTLDEIDSGKYTDLQLAAWVTLTSTEPIAIATVGTNLKTIQDITLDNKSQLTTRQLIKAHEIVKQRHIFKNTVSGQKLLKSLPMKLLRRVR